MVSSISSEDRPAHSRTTGYRDIWHGFLLLLLGMAWGLEFILLKITSNAGINEISILCTTMFLLATGYLVVLICCRAVFRPSLCQIRYFMLSGLFGFVMPLGATVFALTHISAGEIVLIEALSPAFTVGIAMMLRTERVSGSRIGSVVLGLIGVVILYQSTTVNGGNQHIIGLTIALAVPLFCAIDYIYVATSWPSNLSTIQVVTGEAVAGALLLIPILLWSADTHPTVNQGTGQLAIIAFVFLSFFEGYLYFYLLKHANAVFVSLASFIGLISGILLSILLLEEAHPISTWLALILITGAMLIALFAKGRRQC